MGPMPTADRKVPLDVKVVEETKQDGYVRKKITYAAETGDRVPAVRKPDGWTRDGIPLPHNQPWYDEWKRQGKSSLEPPK